MLMNLKVFRTIDGHPLKETALRLMLKDFGTNELTQEWPDLSQEITISSEQLCDYLQEAEARQAAYVRRVGSINNVRPGALKRRRTETPPDNTSSEDVSKYEAVERDSKRGRIDDNDYSPSSSLTHSDS